ncbi:hypothetical protein METBIDRAFT_102825 [Metschnikowia bicuspidata var. bicuspidata NRRL YB-4993]|uniref:Uncharacterized protein n=1 Tax=Metschnikowia bicuspidata var. bicuspidata NRRL YB-4993 TaxID=869754 RepID=A0A1A0HGG0_9ASCO|nr:hypothetical protein METBIDRAFT_102825 [Metschnikowia bicuspidata var. bicuspidata NRRL YB-4993]OBA23254.1 hypothetical protein METBIDRAFT_102825 [Metschnikowia bicuspidata var. bicuspidata NRRL YB-4993]
MSLSAACDDLLALGLLQHEYGIPTLWPRTAPVVQKPDLEAEYYALNQTLATRVNRVVFLNKIAELRQADPQAVGETYAEAFRSGVVAHMSFAEKERHLQGMAAFKTAELTAGFLAAALPVLRSIYQDNLALTDAEFTILNNLKKLYSHYNEHPANIQRLLAEYNTQKAAVGAEIRAHRQIHDFLATDLTPNLAELEALNNEYLALQNTYDNKLGARETGSLDPLLQKLKQACLTLSRRLTRLGTLCEFLPNLVLCQASNWYADKALLAVVQECQDLAETLAGFPDARELGLADEILKVDFAGLDL